jgi:transcriptional regulator with XRE-family HTH domain
MAVDKLKQALAERGLTSGELAKKTGLAKRLIDSWLYAKKTNPCVSEFSKAADALGVSMEYLLTGKDGSALTEDERLILSVYRDTPKDLRKILIRVARAVKDD